MSDGTFNASYMRGKEPYLEAVQSRLSGFFSRAYGDGGEEAYRELRKANITDENILSVSIPWVLADLCGIEAKKCVGIASSWEAIMLYVRQLDTVSDKTELSLDDKTRLLTASMLFVHGLEGLKTEVGESSSNDLCALFDAARHQMSDLSLAKEKENESDEQRSVEDHLVVMRGKNAFVKVIKGYYLANSDIDPNDLECFIDNLSTFAQIIDDIKDLEVDVSESSYSHLLSIGRDRGLAFTSPSGAVYLLLSNGLLRRSLELAVQYLSQATNVANKVYLNQKTSSISSKKLASHLEDELRHVYSVLDYISILEKMRRVDKSSIEILKGKINGLVMSS